MKSNILISALVMALACQPAKSDVFVEMVNAELLKKLVAGADSVEPVQPDSSRMQQLPLWVKGERLLFSATAKNTVLWYDEQGNLTGMLEYEKGKLKDSIAFHPNGQRMFTLIIDKDGFASGPARYYYPDGRVKEDGRFTKGVKTGVWREFNTDGRLIESREFDRYGKPSR
jgi:hypothetical protein